MGLMVAYCCAAPGCASYCSSDCPGVFIDVSAVFSKPLPQGTGKQLWTCSAAHRREALQYILKDLPFRHSKQAQQQLQQQQQALLLAQQSSGGSGSGFTS